jgi:hypothetical protein
MEDADGDAVVQQRPKVELQLDFDVRLGARSREVSANVPVKLGVIYISYNNNKKSWWKMKVIG